MYKEIILTVYVENQERVLILVATVLDLAARALSIQPLNENWLEVL